MTVNVEEIIIRKTVLIHAPIDHVFEVFTAKHDAWWPRTKHTGQSAAFTAVLEPHVGGRWYERADDGTQGVFWHGRRRIGSC